MSKNNSFFQEIITISFSYCIFSFFFGFTSASFKLDIFRTTIMSALIYAGAAQNIILNSWYISQLNLFSLMSVIIINSRNSMYCNLLKKKHSEYYSGIRGFLLSLFITDEFFYYATRKKRTEDYENSEWKGLIYLAVIPYVLYIIFTMLGYKTGLILNFMNINSVSVFPLLLFIVFLIESSINSYRHFFMAGLVVPIYCLSLYCELNRDISRIFAVLISLLLICFFEKQIRNKNKANGETK